MSEKSTLNHAQNKPVGVLALQGDFSAHRAALERFFTESKDSPQIPNSSIEVRKAEELYNISGLIIPGGESSTLLRLLDQNFRLEIIKQACAGLPILGTCAGSILISKRVLNPEQESLQLIDITIERNSYGRQTDSFIVEKLDVGTNEQDDSFLSSLGNADLSHEGIFIRAPRVLSLGREEQAILYHKEDPVLVRKNNILAATFHPELSEKKHLVYKLFLDIVKRRTIQ